MRNTNNLSYAAKEVYAHDSARYLLSLFVAEPAREKLLTLYALNSELAGIHRAVREEMIGHIRYAWWQEIIEGLYDGTVRAGHPISEALAPIIVSGILPQAELMKLVEAYRSTYPQMPDVNAIIENLSLILLRALKPESIPAFQKASNIIARHKGGKAWLSLKLLLAGF